MRRMGKGQKRVHSQKRLRSGEMLHHEGTGKGSAIVGLGGQTDGEIGAGHRCVERHGTTRERRYG